ncbi:MAG: hypothetical protein HUU35_09355, partial [Armatimonadetes bacterium]|nr:hypothetical protein [Armatimonadota bacterium]
MKREVVAWLEQGLTRAFDYLGLETPTTAVQAQVVALLPPVAGLARLWGAVDPARANGVAAAVANP